MGPEKLILYVGPGPCWINNVTATALASCHNPEHYHPQDNTIPVDSDRFFEFLNVDAEETELERKFNKKKRVEEIRSGWKDGKHNKRKPWEK